MLEHEKASVRRSLLKMRTSLLGTIVWGVMETTLLTIIWWIDRNLYEGFHSKFMRLLHGHFGGVVIPSTRSLETSHSKRNWEERTKMVRVNKHGNRDPKGQFIKHGDVLILPTEEVLSLLLRSNMRANIGYCFCRLHAKKLGKPCPMDAPIETCMTLSFPENVEMINMKEPKPERVKQKRQIYNLLKKCEEIGLVHQIVFAETNNVYVICNCCPCCCEVLSSHFRSLKENKYHRKKIEQFNQLKTQLEASELNPEDLKTYKKIKRNIKQHRIAADLEPTPLVVKSAFVSVTTEPDKCKNCGTCAERCYFGARTMEHGVMHYYPDLCTGCGLCVSTCPEDILQLKKRSKIKDMSNGKPGINHVHPHGSATPHNHA